MRAVRHLPRGMPVEDYLRRSGSHDSQPKVHVTSRRILKDSQHQHSLCLHERDCLNFISFISAHPRQSRDTDIAREIDLPYHWARCSFIKSESVEYKRYGRMRPSKI